MSNAKLRIPLDIAAAHAKVREVLFKLQSSHGLNIEQFQPIAQGGQSVIFAYIANNTTTLLKVPNYATRPHCQHWVLERDIAKESKLLETVKCWAVPRFIDGDESGTYILREMVEGVELSSYINTAEFTADKKQHLLIASLASTTHCLFKAFHNNRLECFSIRDYKPRNVIIEKQTKRLRLIDVGSARPERDMVSTNARHYRLGSGKFLFWAPEQLMAKKEFCNRSVDYFSFGVMVYYLLYKEMPYTNSENEPSAALTVYLQEYEDVLSNMMKHDGNCSLRPEALTFVRQCLHPDAKWRPTQFDEEVVELFR